MKDISRYIGSQFGNPRGLIGKIICFFMTRINKIMYYSIASYLSSEKRILEIGYGNGYLISKMYRKTQSKIDGIDISSDMMKVATKRNKKGVNCGDIQLYIGDCCDLKFTESTFDAVTTVNTIYFWEDTIQGLKEIYRVLRKDGIFFNAVYSKQWMSKSSYLNEGKKMFEKEEYISMVKDAGFLDVKIVDIIDGTNYLIICKK